MGKRLRHAPRIYWTLFVLQTASALFLFWMVFPIFQQLITHLGEQQDLGPGKQMAIVGGTLFLYFLYWTRLTSIAMVKPRPNLFLYHVCSFAGRVSFFFGSALFSAVFFRHVPELDALPAPGQAVIKVAYLIGILFGLFCYSLELERLARAFEPAGDDNDEAHPEC